MRNQGFVCGCFPDRVLPGRMDLRAFVAVAQIVSALAVTLTLIAVIVSLRQNTRSQKALAVESLAAAITAINVPAMESPALGAALAKATADWNSARREEQIIVHFFLFAPPNEVIICTFLICVLFVYTLPSPIPVGFSTGVQLNPFVSTKISKLQRNIMFAHLFVR